MWSIDYEGKEGRHNTASRRMVLMSPFAGRQWRCRHRKRRGLRTRWGKESVGRIERRTKTYTLPHVKLDCQGKFAV